MYMVGANKTGKGWVWWGWREVGMLQRWLNIDVCGSVILKQTSDYRLVCGLV